MMSISHFKAPSHPLTWLISGCSSGIGLSLARQVQANGDILIASSRNPSRTPELVEEVEARGGKWIRLDVDDSECGLVVDDLEKQGHHIDVLVNNAGYSILAAVEQYTEAELRRQMETLYFGPCRLMRAALAWMRARRFGVVVNISSGAGPEANPSMGAYGAAKAALDGQSVRSALLSYRWTQAAANLGPQEYPKLSRKKLPISKSAF